MSILSKSSDCPSYEPSFKRSCSLLLLFANILPFYFFIISATNHLCLVHHLVALQHWMENLLQLPSSVTNDVLMSTILAEIHQMSSLLRALAPTSSSVSSGLLQQPLVTQGQMISQQVKLSVGYQVTNGGLQENSTRSPRCIAPLFI